MSYTPQANLTIKRRFLLGRYDATYELASDLSALNLPPLADALINSVLPAQARSQEKVTDIKGADLPIEEMLRIEGKVWRGDNETPAEPCDFTIAVFTKFSEFVGNHHIAHTVHSSWHGLSSDEVPLDAIARAFPLRIERLRLEMQLFESQRTIMLGFMPTVTNTLVLSWDNEKLTLRIEAEGLATRATLPFGRNSPLDSLTAVLKRQLGFDVLADWAARAGIHS